MQIGDSGIDMATMRQKNTLVHTMALALASAHAYIADSDLKRFEMDSYPIFDDC